MDIEVLERCKEIYNDPKRQPFPSKNKIVICGIITKDKNKALSVLQDKGVVDIRQTHSFIEGKLGNEYYIWCDNKYNCHGRRFHKVIIDKDIDEELFKYAISCCGMYCRSMEIV